MSGVATPCVFFMYSNANMIKILEQSKIKSVFLDLLVDSLPQILLQVLLSSAFFEYRSQPSIAINLSAKFRCLFKYFIHLQNVIYKICCADNVFDSGRGIFERKKSMPEHEISSNITGDCMLNTKLQTNCLAKRWMNCKRPKTINYSIMDMPSYEYIIFQ